MLKTVLMNTIHYNDIVQLPPCVATIGFFDGVHRGHQFLIHHLVETARKDGLQSTVITFDAHPRKVLQADYQPEMLSTLDSKLLLLSKTEVDNAVVLHFDKAMAAMSAREFMQQVLHAAPFPQGSCAERSGQRHRPRQMACCLLRRGCSSHPKKSS